MFSGLGLFLILSSSSFLKMAPMRVWFSSGFPPGAGFPREKFAPAWL
jgi:hypothetical protein